MKGFEWWWIDLLGRVWARMYEDSAERWVRIRVRFELEHPDLYGDHPTA